jgi:hypothetical protein
MTMHEQMGELWNEDVRIEAIWPVPQVNAPEGLIDAIDLTEDLPQPFKDYLGGTWDKERVERLCGGSSEQREAWEELFGDMAFRRQGGFLIAVARPVCQRFGSRNSFTSSWGYYHNELLFAETLDQGFKDAVAWGEERRESDLAEKADA